MGASPPPRVLLLAAATCAAAGVGAAAPGRGLWVWGGATSPLTNATAQADFFVWASAQAQRGTPVATMLLEDEALGSDSFPSVVKMGAGGGMATQALYGWNAAKDGAFPTAAALKFVDRVVALAPSVGPGLSGISFDIEPRQPETYQAYAELLAKVRAKLGAANGQRELEGHAPLTLSIAGSWGYANQNVSCGALGTLTMERCAVSYVDTCEVTAQRLCCSAQMPHKSDAAAQTS